MVAQAHDAHHDLPLNTHDHSDDGLTPTSLDTAIGVANQQRREDAQAAGLVTSNLLTPVTAIRNAFRYAAKHPIKALGIYFGYAAVGAAAAATGSVITDDPINITNVITTGLLAWPATKIAVGASKLAFYTYGRLRDYFRGSTSMTSHRSLEGTGSLVGLGVVGLSALFMGNMYGGVELVTKPLLYTSGKIGHKAMVLFAPEFEGTYLDTYTSKPSRAACDARRAESGWQGTFGIPCRNEYGFYEWAVNLSGKGKDPIKDALVWSGALNKGPQ